MGNNSETTATEKKLKYEIWNSWWEKERQFKNKKMLLKNDLIETLGQQIFSPLL